MTIYGVASQAALRSLGNGVCNNGFRNRVHIDNVSVVGTRVVFPKGGQAVLLGVAFTGVQVLR